MLGPSRADVMQLLSLPHAESCLPLTLGDMSPTMLLRVEDGRWVIRRLVVNEQTARRGRRRAMRRDGTWMPENEWAHMEPGPVALSADTREALRAIFQRMTDAEFNRRGFGPAQAVPRDARRRSWQARGETRTICPRPAR